MTNENFNTTAQNAPQRIAHWLFHHFRSWRALAFLTVISVLTFVSLRFNVALGEIMASDALTRELFPVGFGSLDLAALLLASWLTLRNAPLIRKAIAWTWFSYLLTLSIWAAMSFTLSSDARLAQSGYELMRDSKVRALQQAEQEVEVAQANYANTKQYKQLRKAELLHAQEYRDRLIKDVEKLNNDNPHVSMAIYYRVSALLHNHYDIDLEPEDLSSVVRMAWALALSLSPFILVGLLSFEIASMPQNRTKKRLSPGEKDSFSSNKWQNFDNPANTSPIIAERAHGMGNEAETATLDREALAKVRDWLEGQTGRITRAKIKYRSGNLPYDSVTLIIQELLNEGSLRRLSNGQLSTPETRLHAV